MEKKRSVGIAAVGIIEILIGILGVLGCIYAWQVVNDLHAIGDTGGSSEGMSAKVGLLFIAPFIIGSLSGVLFLFLGMLVLTLKPIARMVHIILSPIISILFILFLLGNYVLLEMNGTIKSFFAPTVLIMIGGIITIISMVGMIYFFTRPKVKEQFSAEGGSAPGGK